MHRLRQPLIVLLVIAALVALWMRSRAPSDGIAVAMHRVTVNQPVPVDTGPPPPMALANDRMPTAVEAKISHWSPTPSAGAPIASLAAADPAPKTQASSANPSAPTLSPFPEPKKVLTPEEIEKGQW